MNSQQQSIILIETIRKTIESALDISEFVGDGQQGVEHIRQALRQALWATSQSQTLLLKSLAE